MKTITLLRALGALACLSATGAALSGPGVPGQKLDSGLGNLPHYSQWQDASGRASLHAAVPGESLDDGLGTLPPYALWKDRSGKDPMGLNAGVQVSSAR